MDPHHDFSEEQIAEEQVRYATVAGKPCSRRTAIHGLLSQSGAAPNSRYQSAEDRRGNAERQRRWRARNSDHIQRKDRDKYLRRSYGITLEDYDDGHVRRDGACDVCGALKNKSNKDRLNVDHNHETGEVRGLLCRACNTGIGQLGDDVAGLRRALAYLESPPGIL